MFETVGQILKQTRIDRSLSLEQVYLATHIRTKYLEALESDNRNLLPSDVQGKGFLRLYAEFLDLPVEELLGIWNGRSPSMPLINKESRDVLVPQKITPPSPELDADKPDSQPDTAFESLPAHSPPVDTRAQFTLDDSESGQIFAEVGRTLKNQRELISLPLSEIENMIKIRLHYLQALEEGRMSDLPSPVQARGMLSNYARLLNLDSEKLLLRYAEGLQVQRGERSSGDTRPKKAGRTRQPPKTPSRFNRLVTADLIIVGFVIILIFGFTLWGSSRVSSYRDLSKSTSPPSISEFLLTTQTMTVLPGITPLSSTSVSGSLSESIRPTPSPRITSDINSQINQQGTSPLQISVLARQRTWLQVIADKKNVFNGRILPGGSYQYSATERIEVTAGNAAAIQISFNQKDMGTLGLNGQVVGLVFTKDGMRNPTPTVTATPTRTVPVTPSVTGTPNPAIKTATVTPFIP